jgi:hypothetical protein
MKQFLPGKTWISLVVFVLVASGGAIASENKKFATQGKVMELNLSKNILIVNEQTFVLDQNTTIRDSKGSSLAVEGLEVKTWVYIEGVRGGRGQPVVAMKIYVLQKRISRQERHLYPFMQPVAED